LRGRRIEACTADGTVIASGDLGATPWPDTEALYWTTLELPAPAQQGAVTLSIRCAGAGLVPPHRDAASRFGVVAVPAPEHTLSIRVTEHEKGGPITGAEIRLGAHRATTGASGEAQVRLAKGRYDLTLWKAGYDMPPQTVAVEGDQALEIKAAIVPEENADRAWKA
jgi:hypothetical protein